LRRGPNPSSVNSPPARPLGLIWAVLSTKSPGMKKSILFVEDNALLRQMYGMMMEGEAAIWDAVSAADAREALRLMEKRHFDVVVSDLRMPGMDGIELMGVVRQLYPRSSRIILSGLSDQAEIARSLDSTHQFLAKPFDFKALKATLLRLGGLDAYLKDARLQSLVGQMRVLPSFPMVYHEIMKELGGEDPSIEKLAQIIAQDPSMTAKLLQIANSAAGGRATQAASPFEAVQFVGLSAVRSLALSAHIFRSFEHVKLNEFSINTLWDHTVRSGLIASTIMQTERADPAEAEEAHIGGMLHDLGKLMLADSMPERFQQALALAAERNIASHQAEKEVFGADHGGVAAYLLSLWGLPVTMVEAVAFHHCPSSSEHVAFGPLTAVHVADVLEHELSEEPLSGQAPTLDTKYLAAIGMDDRLEAWREAVAEELAAEEVD
jgi:HD-like signal output (HDOD) protein/ActR/RegA family two-component response regulator